MEAPASPLQPEFRTRLWDAGVLLALLGLIVLRARPEFQLDEDRFVDYADHLLRGYYADPATKFIWNGPGYPLLLAPFRFLGASLLLAKLLNAFFLLGALVYIRRTLCLYLPARRAAWLSYAAFGYLVLFGFSWLHLLMTESFSVFLVSGMLHHFCVSGTSPRPRRHGLAAAAFAGALALTKFFFGYVLAFQLVLGLGGMALRNRAWARGAAVSGLALALCLPYLAYTYSLTGRVFYWGNTGGAQLYTLTLPEKHLLGDVVPIELVTQYPEFFPSEAPLLDSIKSWDEVRRDQAFRAAALRNIRAHPGKVFQNWRANVNRLVFDAPFSHFPTSHSQQRTGNLSFVFAPVWFAMLLCLFPAFRRIRAFAPEFLWMLVFAAVSLGGLSVVSAYARFVFPLLPVLLVWITLTATKVLEIRFRTEHP